MGAMSWELGRKVPLFVRHRIGESSSIPDVTPRSIPAMQGTERGAKLGTDKLYRAHVRHEEGVRTW